MNFELSCLCPESFEPERENEMDWVAEEDAQFQQYLTIHRQVSTILRDHEAERVMFPNRPQYLAPVDDTKLYLIRPTCSIRKEDEYLHDNNTPYAKFDPFFHLPYSKDDLDEDQVMHFFPQMQPRKCVMSVSTGHLIYSYGGSRSNILADMWCYNTENELWHRVSGVFSCFHVRSEELYYLHLNAMGRPTSLQELGYPRSQIAVTMVSTTDCGVHWKDAELLLYGGWTGNLAVNELWSFSCRYRTWKRVHAKYEEQLPCRYDHIARIIGRYMIVFGGFSHDFSLNSICLGDTQIYDIANNTWLILDQSNLGLHKPPPSGRLVNCVHDNKLFIAMGGINDSCTFNDVYYFDPAIMKWSQILPRNTSLVPQPRYMLCGQILHDHLIFFGGKQEGQFMNEVWMFDLEQRLWTNISELLYQKLGKDGRKTLVNEMGQELLITPETLEQFNTFRKNISPQAFQELQQKASSKFSTAEEKRNLNRLIYQLTPMARAHHYSCTTHPESVLYIFGGLMQHKVSLGDVWQVKLRYSSLPKRMYLFPFFVDVLFEYELSSCQTLLKADYFPD